MFFSVALALILIFSEQVFPPGSQDESTVTQGGLPEDAHSKTGELENAKVQGQDEGSLPKENLKVIAGPEIWSQNAARFVQEMEACFILSLKDYPPSEIEKLQREDFLDLLQIYGQVAQRNEEFKEYHVELSSGLQRRLTLRNPDSESELDGALDDQGGETRSASREAQAALEGQELLLAEKAPDGDWVEIDLPEDLRFNPAPNAVANLVNEGTVKREIIKESFYFAQGEEAVLRSQDERVTDISISTLEKNLVCQDILTKDMTCNCRDTVTY